MNTLFFELLRVAIGSQGSLSRMPSESEWNRLYMMAKKQSLLGVCFAAIQRLVTSPDGGRDRVGISKQLYLAWMGVAVKIQKKNEVVNRQCADLFKRISADGLRSFIMKGQANAVLYKDLALMRQSGDIDVYIEGGLEKLLSYSRSFGQPEHVNELEMHVHVFEDTEVEFHYRPFIMRNPWRNRKLQEFFKREEEECFANRLYLSGDNFEICTPTIEFNLVHQLAHIHLHLFTEGVGLRQLMDYYYVLQTNSIRELRVQEIQDVVTVLGLNRFASALMWVLGHVFGMDESRMLWSPNAKDGQFLLGEIMQSGNFGKYNESQNEKKSKLGYSLWSLLIRNLNLSRFDNSDWFWGPLWRVYHRIWKLLNGYR